MIEINDHAFEAMITDAVHTFPDECCGFMFGKEVNDVRHIISVLPVINSREGSKRRNFEISPKDYMQAENYAEEQKLFLLGIYHSHPDHPSQPSIHDLKAAQPFFSYVIISVLKKEFASIQSWRLTDDDLFTEENIISKTKIHN